jgi:hypothetical protein
VPKIGAKARQANRATADAYRGVVECMRAAGRIDPSVDVDHVRLRRLAGVPLHRPRSGLREIGRVFETMLDGLIHEGDR